MFAPTLTIFSRNRRSLEPAGASNVGRPVVVVALGQANHQLVTAKLIDSLQDLVELGCHIDFGRASSTGRSRIAESRRSPLLGETMATDRVPICTRPFSANFARMRSGAEHFAIVGHREDVPVARQQLVGAAELSFAGSVVARPDGPIGPRALARSRATVVDRAVAGAADSALRRIRIRSDSPPSKNPPVRSCSRRVASREPDYHHQTCKFHARCDRRA